LRVEAALERLRVVVVERRAELDEVAFGVDLEEVRGDFESLEVDFRLGVESE